MVQPQAIWLLALMLALLIALHLAARRTLMGRSIVALAQDELGARVCGVPVDQVRTGVFALAAAQAAVLGLVFGSLTAVNYETGLEFTLRGLIAALLGGMTSIPGAVLGGLFLGLSESLTASFISSQLKTPISFALLFALLVVRPTGLSRG